MFGQVITTDNSAFPYQPVPSFHQLLDQVNEAVVLYHAAKPPPITPRSVLNRQYIQAQAQEADLRGKLLTLELDIALRVGGIEPMPLPDSLRVGISMRPSGKIAPALMDDPNRQPDAIIVTYEEFVAIAQRLKDGFLKRTIVLTSEDEIPRLIYNMALKSP